MPEQSGLSWQRINKGMVRAERFYPGVVGQVLAGELNSWHNAGSVFGAAPLINQLLDHLEKLAQAAEDPEPAGEDIGVVTNGVVVHRAEVEG